MGKCQHNKSVAWTQTSLCQYMQANPHGGHTHLVPWIAHSRPECISTAAVSISMSCYCMTHLINVCFGEIGESVNSGTICSIAT